MMWEIQTAMVCSYLGNVLTYAVDHQHHLLSSWQVQNKLDAPKIHAVASDWLCCCQAERYPRCEDNPCHAQYWMLDRPQNGQIYAQATHCNSASVPKSLDHHLTWPDWNTPTTATGFGKHLMRSSRSVHPTLKTAQRGGASLRRSSLKQKKLSLLCKKCEHQGWFDENDECITQLLHANNQAYVEWQNDPDSKAKTDKFRHLRGQAQKGLCQMKDNWWDRKADEVQKYAD